MTNDYFCPAQYACFVFFLLMQVVHKQKSLVKDTNIDAGKSSNIQKIKCADCQCKYSIVGKQEPQKCSSEQGSKNKFKTGENQGIISPFTLFT